MSLRHALLGLLAQHPGSGWDLLKRFESSLASVWPATQSQLYTELGKLTEDGLLEGVGRRRPQPQGVRHHRQRPGRKLEHSCRSRSRPSATAATMRCFRRSSCGPSTRRRRGVTSSAKPRRTGTITISSSRCASRSSGTTATSTGSGRLVLENGLRITKVTEDWARWAATEVS